jgi:LAS superfamily LD-carboxypeptidase LdcB
MDIFQSSGEEDGGLARFNSTASPNVVAMVNAAGSGGLKASSSFRSMAKQTELYNCAPGCTGGNPAAKPGYSNHQMGFAFDFSNGSSSWSWMRGNAEKYGYKWLGTKDPVHWSTTGG